MDLSTQSVWAIVGLIALFPICDTISGWIREHYQTKAKGANRP